MKEKQKKKQYDFAFVYEVKNRELDSLLLLKSELEHRGYSVKLIETWEQECRRDVPPFAKVTTSFALHNNETMQYVSQFVRGCEKYVNLQWEQVYTNGDRMQKAEDGGTTGVFEDAKLGMHLCWGEKTRKDLVEKYHLREDHAVVTGCISLDFLRPEFRSCYPSKEEIIETWHLSGYKKIYMMISSFSYGQLPESLLNSEIYQKQGFDVMAQCRISTESQKIVLDWLEEEVKQHPEILMIYRPHPAESNIDRLYELEKSCANFRVIPDASIRQWILIADQMFTWWSTSVAEIYAAGKGCSILRPVELPYRNELEIYNGAHFVKTFEEFNADYLKEADFPIPDSLMRQYYDLDKSRPAFMRIADTLEHVYKNDAYLVRGYENLSMNAARITLMNLKRFMKQTVFDHPKLYRLAQKLLGERKTGGGLSLSELKDEFAYFAEMKEKNRMDDREMRKRQKELEEIAAKFRIPKNAETL